MPEDQESEDFCLKDYYNNHCFSSIGVYQRHDCTIIEVFKCSQCEKVILKELEVLP